MKRVTDLCLVCTTAIAVAWGTRITTSDDSDYVLTGFFLCSARVPLTSMTGLRKIA